jgi:hypothetical protein
MNKFHLLLIAFIFFRCGGSITNKEDSSLSQIVDERIAALDNNFRYNVLASSKKLLDYNSILDLIKELKNKKETKKLNDELKFWADSLNIFIPEIRKSDFYKDLDIAMILLLDELIIRTLNSSSSFSELEPIVFLEQENDSVAFFYLTLHARDSLSLPEVLIELPTGTFPILVDEQTGLAHFSMRKKHSNDKKSFKGRIIFMKDMNTKTIKPFEYPRELIGERDKKLHYIQYEIMAGQR